MSGEQRDEQTYALIGAAMEVHKLLGCGFLEVVYQEALALEYGLRGIPFEREVTLPISYKEQTLSCSYRADFVCYGEIIVELKAINKLTGIEQSQLHNYLNATGLHCGLLINFGARSLEYERRIF